MIVVVEGPSAAGKTTWVDAHRGASVLPEERRDSPSDAPAAARFWAANGAERWGRALGLEQATGLAVCDTDPLKLHYAWSLWRIGAGTAEEFEHQVAAYREAVSDRRIGFADRYLVTVPALETLEARRSADTGRRRRNFHAHSRLGKPLREWYSALEAVRPGSVRWDLDVDALSERESRDDRYRVEDLDALLGRLPVP